MKKLYFFAVAALLLFSCTPIVTPGDNNSNDKPGTVQVTEITLDKADVSLKEGESVTLIATVKPDNATNKSVTWTSSNEAVATVDNSGKVTGVKEGNATITATTVDGGKKATCAVIINFDNGNNQEELVVTGDAPYVSAYVATLTGYANLPLELGSAEVGVVYDVKQSFTDSKNLIADAVDGNNKFTVTATSLMPKTQYYFKAYVKNGMATKYGKEKTFTTNDQGIVITMTRGDGSIYNLYWATSNLCDAGLCDNPWDYGDHYAWGETTTYYSSLNPLTWKSGKTDGYWWPSYKWCSGSSAKMTKYCSKSSAGYNGFTDKKTALDLEDDAANAKLGGKWRMPTDAEWTELSTKCTLTWETNYNGSGVNGRLVTGPNGSSIFLPAAGYRGDKRLDDAGSNGNYWSSSLNTGAPNGAWYMYFDSDGGEIAHYNRFLGLSVRPVTE